MPVDAFFMRLELYEVFIFAPLYSVQKNVYNHQDLCSDCADCFTVFYLDPCFHTQDYSLHYSRKLIC